MWRRLGAKVTVVEWLDRITPGMDLEVSRQFQRLLSRQGLGFKLGTKVTEVDDAGDRLVITTEAAEGGEPEKMKADVVLVAVGRRPYTEGLGPGERRPHHRQPRPDRGRPALRDQRSRACIAIGDVIKGPMLAHKAEDEGVCVAEHLAGASPHIDYDAIPAVIYTAPEVASVGKTEEQLKEAEHRLQDRQVPVLGQRAGARDRPDRRLRQGARRCRRRDRLLGVHIIGAEAGTMIAEAALAMEFGASSEDLARTSHAHPTLEEAIKEAALAAHGAPLHI